MTDELNPYLVYRILGAEVECAVWQLKEGPMALALFLSDESARTYHKAAALGEEWKVFRPARTALFQLAQAAVQSGINYAVLDPDVMTAKRIFDLQSIVAGLGQSEK
jgi:hypothetical protein